MEQLYPENLGGIEAKPGEFPYRVSLQWYVPPLTSFFHFCAGVILSERWILTQAECAKFIKTFVIDNNQTRRRIIVKAGKHDLGKIEDFEQTSTVDNIYLLHE